MAIRESTDRRRLRGMRTRQAILVHAARVGSAEGLEAVSLQRLAGDLGISKSGLFAHFGSKEELHMATIEAAAQIFTDEVLRPALQVPRGLGRVWALCNSWLSYLERGVFPGGCFFWAVAEEFDSRRPGPVRDSVLEKKNYWSYSLQRAVREARSRTARLGARQPARWGEQWLQGRRRRASDRARAPRDPGPPVARGHRRRQTPDPHPDEGRVRTAARAGIQLGVPARAWIR